MTEFNELGQFLKTHRNKAGLTQAELANALGDVHTQFVSNWERGMCAPPNHCFQKLIDVLSINRNKLVQVMVSDSKKIIESRVFVKTKAATKRKA